MNSENYLNVGDKARIIQEIVPGKQITLAHIIANPDKVLYYKLGLDPSQGFVDRFSGTVIVTGTVSQVEAALSAVNEYAINKLGFAVCEITRT